MERIKAVAMDMWEPYFKATLKHVPDAAGKIVHDRFHVMKHVGEAVDRYASKSTANSQVRMTIDSRARNSSGYTGRRICRTNTGQPWRP